MRVTFTGLDIKTYLPKLPYGYEFGILYSVKSLDRPRYPSRSAISNMLDNLSSKSTALHICGTKARQQLLDYSIPDLTHKVQRIQVNGNIDIFELEHLCELYSDHIIITQHTSRNMQLLDLGNTNHAVLVDNSGGRGKLPEGWEMPNTTKDVGFAGGLNPDNIKEELDKIKKVVEGNWWIDMESGIRNSLDWLSPQKMHQIVKIIEEN